MCSIMVRYFEAVFILPVNTLLNWFDSNTIQNGMIIYGKILHFVISKEYDWQFSSYYVYSWGPDTSRHIVSFTLCTLYKECINNLKYSNTTQQLKQNKNSYSRVHSFVHLDQAYCTLCTLGIECSCKCH